MAIGAQEARAQIADSVRVRDSIQQARLDLERARITSKLDSAGQARNQRRFDSLKARSERSNFWGRIYRVLIREPSNPLRVQDDKDANLDNKYAYFNGRVIRRVIIKPLDVFGPKVFDTLAEPRNILERAGNAVHTRTRQRVVADQLTFRAGDRFISTLLSNNERVLRQSGTLIDARIIPMRTGWRDSVDILVLTQDVFSLGVGGGFGSLNDFDLQLSERNFLGLNHQASARYRFTGTFPQRHNVYGYYFIPYLVRRSFISGEVEAVSSFEQQLARGRVFKDFLFLQTRWAGSAEIFWRAYNPPIFLNGEFALAPVEVVTTDAWLGRALRINSGDSAADERIRLIVSGRILTNSFERRPLANLDTNQFLLNNRLVLWQVGYSDRNYFRDILINGYGRTEDVPYGLSLSLTAGQEIFGTASRQYGGIRYSQARFDPGLGYLNYTLEVGTFIKYVTPQQGALRGSIFYFSPLGQLGRVYLRQFLRVRYVQGVNRFVGEFTTFNNQRGLTGISHPNLNGLRGLAVSLETVTFFDFDLLSFKAAPFAGVDMVWVDQQVGQWALQAPYQGYSIGVRLHNERLSLRTFQIRLTWYTGLPGVSDPFRPNFAAGTPLRLNDFSINEPGLVGLDN